MIYLGSLRNTDTEETRHVFQANESSFLVLKAYPGHSDIKISLKKIRTFKAIPTLESLIMIYKWNTDVYCLTQDLRKLLRTAEKKLTLYTMDNITVVGQGENFFLFQCGSNYIKITQEPKSFSIIPEFIRQRSNDTREPKSFSIIHSLIQQNVNAIKVKDVNRLKEEAELIPAIVEEMTKAIQLLKESIDTYNGNP
jgi:hypothetical protein